MRTTSLCALSALVTLAFVPTIAGATAQRTFVASNGSDAGACTVAAPCRSFGVAIAHTSAAGEVVVLDSAGYGPVTITQSVSIVAPPGVYAGITVGSGADGVTISAGASDVVLLRGLTINSQGGLDGVRIESGGLVHIENCVIDGMTNDGILFLPSAQMALHVVDTVVRHSGNEGISASGLNLAGAQSTVEIVRSVVTESASVNVFLGDIVRSSIVDTFVSGGSSGIDVEALLSGAANVAASIDRTQITLAQTGLRAGGGNDTATAVVHVSNSVISNNKGSGIDAQDKGIVRLMASQITGNFTGVQISGTGAVGSLGNNMRAGNSSGGAAATALTPY